MDPPLPKPKERGPAARQQQKEAPLAGAAQGTAGLRTTGRTDDERPDGPLAPSGEPIPREPWPKERRGGSVAEWRGNASRPKEPPSPFRTRTGPYFRAMIVVSDSSNCFDNLLQICICLGMRESGFNLQANRRHCV